MLWNPLKKIPQHFREEFLAQQAATIRGRVLAFSITITAIYYLAIVFILWLDPEIFTARRIYMMILLTLGTGAVFFFNRFTKSICTAKLNGFFFVALLMFVLVYGPSQHVRTFNYSNFILTLFFTALMIPWFLRDTVVLVVIHYVAWMLYFRSRDLSTFDLPPTFFGEDPFLNGNIYLLITSIMCLAIRYKENRQEVERFLLFKDVECRKAQMERELEFASRVQETLVPEPLETSKATIHVSYRPASSIGGDYAKFHMLDEDRLIFFISDVTGHGVPAALMVNRLHAEFDSLAKVYKEPGKLLYKLNEFIVHDFQGTNMYLSAFCGVIDFSSSKIRYSNYGHPNQYIYRIQGSEVMGLASQTTLLGIDHSEKERIYETEIDYRAGDWLLLFTDGVLELKNQQGEEFGAERLRTFIQKETTLLHKDFHENLMQELFSFGRGEFQDDVFFLSIKTR